jgi:hypothetical protein
MDEFSGCWEDLQSLFGNQKAFVGSAGWRKTIAR